MLTAWISPEDPPAWGPPRGPLAALAGLAKEPAPVALLQFDDPERELAEGLSFAALARKLRVERLVVAAAHPTRKFLAALAGAGFVSFLLVPEPSWRPGELDESIPLVDLASATCPLLHACGGVEHCGSACGAHHDRMVLAANHLQGWCLGHEGACPHRGRLP